MGVSRTPVRDAIKRLEAEGLLITKPHCGAVVFQLSRENLERNIRGQDTDGTILRHAYLYESIR